MQIKKTKSEGGYFGYFDTIEEAEEFVDEQVRRYQFTPNPENMSINRLCKEAHAKGIKLYPQTFSKELKRRGIEIRDYRPGREKLKKQMTYSVSKTALSYLDNYENKSYIVDLGIKIVLGIPTEDIVIFFPTDKDEEQSNAIFRHRKKGNIEAIISGDLDRKFEQQIRMLLKRAQLNGNQAIIDYAESNRYKYIGGTEILGERQSYSSEQS